MLVDVSHRDLSTSILGYPIDFPVCIASTGMHMLAHPDGEVATAQGELLLSHFSNHDAFVTSDHLFYDLAPLT